MLTHPRTVRFGSLVWDDVIAVAIDRSAHRLVEEWSDAGPYAAFADVPEQRVTIQVVQQVGAEDLAAPRPADQAVLTFDTAPTAAESARRRVTATAVVTAVAHDLSQKRGATRTITLVAVSPDGAADPIAITAP
jgi:hypothetical protein